ncbi:MAG: DUF2079 domain-containing protein [Candidatus Eisenbacteria bacterium]|nr:DUF2079 domain-containing protein [Candidatus Eisenbacteria bacterium]
MSREHPGGGRTLRPAAKPLCRPARHDPPAPARASRLEAFCARRSRAILWAMIALYAAAFSAVCAIKVRYYLYTDFDLAIFAQATDGILRGTTFSSIRGMNWLGDHSSLILFLVAPLYALFRHPLTLLVVQSAALALGALPVAWLARRELGSAALALGFAALYLLDPAVGYTSLYEFHPEVLATPALLFAFFYLRAGRPGRMALAAGVALLCKEDVALVALMLALYALLQRPRQVRAAALLGGLAAASLALSFGVLKRLGSGEVDYGLMYSQWGASPRAVVASLLAHPLRALGAFFTSPGYSFDTVIKLQYYVQMLLPLAFLPLASPLTLALALPIVAEHMLSWRPPQHTILYHYAALATPFFVAAAVLGFRRVAGLARAGAVEHGPPRRARWLMLGALAASLAGNLMFGPLLGTGKLQLVRSEEKTAPTSLDRASARVADRMVAAVGRSGGIEAGFEFLLRFTGRSDVYSLHNVMQGKHTFSEKPYPVPTGIASALADMSHFRLRPYADAGTSRRLRELLRANRLGVVEEAGDLLRFARDARDTVDLVSVGTFTAARPRRIVFDRQLAFLGCDLADPVAHPGGLLPLATYWRRVTSTDSLFVVQLVVADAFGNAVLEHMRYLGYGFAPVADWPESVAVRENYRLILPDRMRPGNYTLGMRVGRRKDLGQKLSEADDPALRARGMFVELGRFEVRPGR